MSHYPPTESEGLQAIPNHDLPEALHHNGISSPYSDTHIEKHRQLDGNLRPWQHPQNENVSADKGSKHICGLRITTLVMALLFLASSVAAIVVGAVLGSRKTFSSCPPPTSTPSLASGSAPSSSVPSSISVTSSTSVASSSSVPSSSKTSTAFTAPTGVTVTTTCPAQPVDRRYNATGNNFQYQVTCGEDCQAHDIMATWAYSLDMCVDACLSFTRNNYTKISPACGSVVFRADMANVTGLGGNCFVKQGSCVAVVQSGVPVSHAVILTWPFDT